MKFERYHPLQILKPFVKEYKIIESEQDVINRILPDTSIVMAFRFGTGEVRMEGMASVIPLSLVSGISKSLRHIEHTKGSKTLLVLFTEVGASVFFKIPLQELFGIQTSLDNLIPKAIISELGLRIYEAENHVMRISIVETFLLGILANQEVDKTVQFAVRKIRESNGMVNIRDLASSLHMSLDPFEKRFGRITGATPKHLSSLVRLRHTVRMVPAAPSMMDVVYEGGYYDQSHMIRFFKRFTGQTPSAFFQSGKFW